jgi:hypothetical protein
MYKESSKQVVRRGKTCVLLKRATRNITERLNISIVFTATAYGQQAPQNSAQYSPDLVKIDFGPNEILTPEQALNHTLALTGLGYRFVGIGKYLRDLHRYNWKGRMINLKAAFNLNIGIIEYGKHFLRDSKRHFIIEKISRYIIEEALCLRTKADIVLVMGSSLGPVIDMQIAHSTRNYVNAIVLESSRCSTR